MHYFTFIISKATWIFDQLEKGSKFLQYQGLGKFKTLNLSWWTVPKIGRSWNCIRRYCAHEQNPDQLCIYEPLWANPDSFKFLSRSCSKSTAKNSKTVWRSKPFRELNSTSRRSLPLAWSQQIYFCLSKRSFYMGNECTGSIAWASFQDSRCRKVHLYRNFSHAWMPKHGHQFERNWSTFFYLKI